VVASQPSRSQKRRSQAPRDPWAVEAVRAAGGTVAREPGETFWGGYDAIVIDPAGHPWEIAHNPYWTISDDGAVKLT
jgi:uncharacterized protein